MIHSVAVRLCLFYLGIIMALSIGFSVVIYNISSNELLRSGHPPGNFMALMGQPARDRFESARLTQVDNSRRHLEGNLIFLNIATLALGAIVSYGLARRTLKPIEEAFEAQGRFTADASHELRTPLTAMQTSIEVGLRNPKLTLAGSKDLLGSMLDEVKKLSSLSNGLLKLTRSGSQDVPTNPVLAQNIIEDAVAQLALTAKQKGITLQSDVSELHVRGDEISLKEIVVILLDNALKYSPSGTTITLSARAQGKFGYITVSDQGQGINATDLDRIFDRFYRADAARSRDQVEGYGLGLSIAQKIAHMYGGAIEVKSKEGEGSAFTLKLPLTPMV